MCISHAHGMRLACVQATAGTPNYMAPELLLAKVMCMACSNVRPMHVYTSASS